ncbi:MAG: glutathione peroxidase [Xanthomonadaceae bacterium]|nr:glutathione peroxidase [Xanthomonadaceae bacterium]
MNRFPLFLLVLLIVGALASPTMAACPDYLDVNKRPLTGGEAVNLCATYKGQVMLVVNTASKCGFTRQFEGLEALYARYKDQGLVVMGFPSNDFGGQEPGTEEQILDFCRLTYGVQFPMFEKTHAARAQADVLYQGLGRETGEFPAWNFHKYLIDREGRVVGSFPSRVTPDDPDLVRAIEGLL